MNNNRKEYTEVLTLLDYFEEEDYEKIPSEVIEAMKNNLDENYQYEFDDEQDIEKQILPGTKAILFNLFRDYLSTPEQREKILKMQAEERKRNELEKQQNYSVNMFKDKQDDIEKENVEEVEITITMYKENFFNKIVKWIKKLFNI